MDKIRNEGQHRWDGLEKKLEGVVEDTEDSGGCR